MTLTRRRLLASSFAAAGTLPLSRVAHGQVAHRITVLHMNDFHSRHEAVDGRAMSCGASRADCFGGSARLATAIRAQRAAAEGDGRAVLLLDAGDQFQGSLFFTAHRGMAELAVMHELGTDAMAVGNHEFDMGPAVLGAFAAAARFPVLSANVDASDEPLLAGRLRPYAVLERAGLPVGLVPGHEDNIKLTYPEDLVRLERLLLPPMMPRVGTGFDVHVLEAGRPLILCGVAVPHERGLAGHSDADVGLHALCDAIYGALAEGDIGRHFPPTEATWKDADSARFLVHAAGRIAARGGRLANADVTLICERPKIAPHAAAMEARIAALMGVEPGVVSVKATTTERLGFAGRGEGIAAQAVATVLLPG